MKQIVRSIGTGTAALAVAAGLTACSRHGGGGARQRPPATVRTATAVRQPAAIVIKGFGNTGDGVSIDVVPQVSGLLVKSWIVDGATVTNGQPLFEIDRRDYEARVRQLEAQVAADRANVELARQTLERNKTLIAKKLISQEDYDTLSVRRDAAVAQQQGDQASLDKADLDLERCTIRSPVDGVCSTRDVDTGNLVAAGATRLTNIRTYDPVYPEFAVSERYLPALRDAMSRSDVRVEVLPRGETNACVGKLVFIDNTVDPRTGTIRLRAEVPNPERRLWAGQFVDVRVYAGEIPEAVMVPESAVRIGKQGPYVFAVTPEGKADLRPVGTGVRHDGLLQIVRGVRAGEKVVALGQLTLYPGAPVREATEAGAGTPEGGGGPAAGAESSPRPGAGSAGPESRPQDKQP